MFTKYADWYDAFNASKDYAAEVDFLLAQASRMCARPERWLDIGCGTGRHMAHLHKRGVAIEGIERSPEMVARGRSLYPALTFHVGTAQDFAVAMNQDVISMLFHVLNYQVSDDMISAALDRVATHLGPDGVFLFDFWNSEAVLRDPPVRRLRVTHIDGRPLFRLSEPLGVSGTRRVEVRYQFRWDSSDGVLAHEEWHVLRHFDAAEVAGLLKRAGLSLRTCTAWMSDRPLSSAAWYGFGVATREEVP